MLWNCWGFITVRLLYHVPPHQLVYQSRVVVLSFNKCHVQCIILHFVLDIHTHETYSSASYKQTLSHHTRVHFCAYSTLNIGSPRTIQLFRLVPMGTTQVILSNNSCKQHLTNNQINTNNFWMFQQIKLKFPQILNKILVFRTLTRQQSDIIIPTTEIYFPQWWV